MSSQTEWNKVNTRDKSKQIKHIDVEFDQDDLNTIIKVFEKIIEDPSDLDYSKMDLSPIHKLEDLTEKLKSHISNAKNAESSQPIIVRMGLSEWAAYSSYVKGAVDDLVLEDNEEELLQELHYKYIEWDAKGITP